MAISLLPVPEPNPVVAFWEGVVLILVWVYVVFAVVVLLPHLLRASWDWLHEALGPPMPASHQVQLPIDGSDDDATLRAAIREMHGQRVLDAVKPVDEARARKVLNAAISVTSHRIH